MQDHESAQQSATREDGAIREEENDQRWARHNAPEVLEHESAQQASAREEQSVQDCESRQQAAARSNRTLDMACMYIDGDYIFHQPCGLWNAPCVHGCRYLHLSSSTPGTRKKCFANGQLLSASNNFDKELMMDHELAYFLMLRLFPEVFHIQ